MHRFLSNNHDELVAKCKLKVAQRPLRAATEKQLAHGVPMFLDQLTRTLAAENDDKAALSIAVSGRSGGDSLALSEVGWSGHCRLDQPQIRASRGTSFHPLPTIDCFCGSP